MSLSSRKPLTAALVLCTALGTGCLMNAIENGNQDGSANGDGGNGSTDMAKIDVKAEFDAKVRPLLVGDCGGCHSMISGGTGPGFLASNPDIFATVIAFPGLIGTTAETSRILTKEPHVGPSYTMPDKAANATVIAAWIKLYNEQGGQAAATGADLSVKPRIEPFLPAAGPKSIDLGLLDASLAGATISFEVTMIGTTQIRLSNIQITATAAKGIHVKTPVFATYAAADPKVAIDINYDYLEKDFTAAPGTSVTFTPSLTIFSYTAGQLLNVSFSILEASAGGADMGGTVTGCKDIAAFNTLLPRFTTAQQGMNNSCNAGNCHGVAGGVGGFNLSGAAAGNMAVCTSVLNNTIVANPQQSPLYMHVTDASNHAGGKMAAAIQAAYLADLTTFANAQK